MSWLILSLFVGGSRAWLVRLLVILTLIVVALLSPPINLLNRLHAFNYTRVSSAGGMVAYPDGAMVSFPSEGVDSFFFVSLKSTPDVDFVEGQAELGLSEAAAGLPDYLIPAGPYYEVGVLGPRPSQALLTIPISSDSPPYETLALYTWTGDAWEHIPTTVQKHDSIIEAKLDSAPDNFMLMQTMPSIPTVAVDVGLQGQLPENVMVTSEVRPGLYLRGDGALDGIAPENSLNTVPVIRNWEGEVVRTDLINNLLNDLGQQENQLTAIEQIAIQNGYRTIIIDYRGVEAIPSARTSFVRLMRDLADRLHDANRTLAVRVEPPRRISADSWDTGGYDWRALSENVDTIIIPVPVDLRAYQSNGDMEALLDWATGLVERRKLQFELVGQSVERAGNHLSIKGYRESLRPLQGLIRMQNVEDSAEISLSLENPRLLSQVIWDESSNMYAYQYIDDLGFERTVYIESAGSLAYKLRLLQAYNIDKILLHTPPSGDVDSNIWDLLLRFQQSGSLFGSIDQLAVAFTVYGPDNTIVFEDVRPLDDPRVVFTRPNVKGDLRGEAYIQSSDGSAVTEKLSVIIPKPVQPSAQAAQPAPAAVEEPIPLETKEPVQSEAGAPSLSSGLIVNVRAGPGTTYPVLGQIVPGQSYRIVARNEENDWWQIEFDGNFGWAIGQFVDLSGDVGRIGVSPDIPAPPGQ